CRSLDDARRRDRHPPFGRGPTDNPSNETRPDALVPCHPFARLPMGTAMDLNSRPVLQDQMARHILSWPGLIVMLVARSVLAVAAQGLVAAILGMQGSRSPWHDAEMWFPVYGTMIDAG